VLAGQTIPKRSLIEESRITKDNLDKFREFCSAA
jgi:hypothetical protein